jgi:hypothetical protein
VRRLVPIRFIFTSTDGETADFEIADFRPASQQFLEDRRPSIDAGLVQHRAFGDAVADAGDTSLTTLRGWACATWKHSQDKGRDQAQCQRHEQNLRIAAYWAMSSPAKPPISFCRSPSQRQDPRNHPGPTEAGEPANARSGSCGLSGRVEAQRSFLAEFLK